MRLTLSGVEPFSLIIELSSYFRAKGVVLSGGRRTVGHLFFWPLCTFSMLHHALIYRFVLTVMYAQLGTMTMD